MFLINDLEANGYGIAELRRRPDLHAERGRCQPDWQPRADCRREPAWARGCWSGTDAIHVPYPSEGGHSDYAPRNEDEIDLLRFLKQKYNGRISFERVVSGRG